VFFLQGKKLYKELESKFFINQLTRYTSHITKIEHKLKFSKIFQQNNLTMHFATGLETAKDLMIWII